MSTLHLFAGRATAALAALALSFTLIAQTVETPAATSAPASVEMA